MSEQFECWISEQVTDVLPRARIEIVDAEDFVPIGDQTFAKMRTDKSSTPGDEDALCLSIGTSHDASVVDLGFKRNGSIAL
jgi:hypothetical protein